MGRAVVALSDAAKTLLARCVPDLELKCIVNPCTSRQSCTLNKKGFSAGLHEPDCNLYHGIKDRTYSVIFEAIERRSIVPANNTPSTPDYSVYNLAAKKVSAGWHPSHLLLSEFFFSSQSPGKQDSDGHDAISPCLCHFSPNFYPFSL